MPPDLSAFLAALWRVLPAADEDEGRRVYRFAWQGDRDGAGEAEHLLRTLYLPLVGKANIMAANVPAKDALGETMLAARGRLRLAKHHAITTGEFGVLTGYAQGYVRQLVSTGTLTRVPGRGYRKPLTERSAIPLLAHCGVIGYTDAFTSAHRVEMVSEGRYGNAGIVEEREPATAKAGTDQRAKGGAPGRVGQQGRTKPGDRRPR